MPVHRCIFVFCVHDGAHEVLSLRRGNFNFCGVVWLSFCVSLDSLAGIRHIVDTYAYEARGFVAAGRVVITAADDNLYLLCRMEFYPWFYGWIRIRLGTVLAKLGWYYLFLFAWGFVELYALFHRKTQNCGEISLRCAWLFVKWWVWISQKWKTYFWCLPWW